MTKPLKARVAALTVRQKEAIDADLTDLESALDDVRIASEELTSAMDDWEAADEREERAEAREAANEKGLLLLEELLTLNEQIAVVVEGDERVGRGEVPALEPGPDVEVTAAGNLGVEELDRSSPRGLLNVIYRSDRTVWDVTVVDQLAAIRQLRAHLEEEEQQLAFGMRLRGETWQTIAQATGLASRQHAMQRFHGAELLDRLSVGFTYADDNDEPEYFECGACGHDGLLSYPCNRCGYRPGGDVTADG